MKRFANIMSVITALAIAGATSTAMAGDTLQVGQKLIPGEALISRNGKFKFELIKQIERPTPEQSEMAAKDGKRNPYRESIRLTVSTGDGRSLIWSSDLSVVFNPMGVDPYLILQADGNLCLYAQSPIEKQKNTKTLLWMSGPTRPTDTDKRVVMQDDGNFCVYWKTHAIWWSKNSRGQRIPLP